MPGEKNSKMENFSEKSRINLKLGNNYRCKLNLRINIKNSKNFQTKWFKNNHWENTNIQENIQKQTLLHAIAIPSKGLLTEVNEDDTIRIVLLVNFETPSYIKGYHEYQKI